MPDFDFFGPAGSPERTSFLAQNPDATFFSYQDQFGGSPNKRRVLSNAFGDIYNRFLGNLGAQIRLGQQPTANFADTIGAPNYFENYYQSLTPTQRGDFRGPILNPATRFIFHF